nr:ATP-dependent DNA helicase PIF1-like [Hydra vulgaris]
MHNVLELTECFRQKNLEFFNALNEIRLGKVTDKFVNLLMTRHFENDVNISSKYVRLCFLNEEVAFYNLHKINDIRSEEKWFYSNDVIINPKVNYMFQIPTCVLLKEGAVVMLVKNVNVEEGLCNGTIGVVTFIESNGVWVCINGREFKIENIKEDILDCTHSVIASKFGLPLQLAFFFTVPKAQGCTLNEAVLNFNSKAFVSLLIYVALSRVCNLNGIYIIHRNKNEIRNVLKNISIDKDVELFYKSSNERYYRETFYYVKDNYKNEDVIEEIELNKQVQSPDEIVYRINEKT